MIILFKSLIFNKGKDTRFYYKVNIFKNKTRDIFPYMRADKKCDNIIDIKFRVTSSCIDPYLFQKLYCREI